MPGQLRRPHGREDRPGGAHHLKTTSKALAARRADRRAAGDDLRGAESGHGLRARVQQNSHGSDCDCGSLPRQSGKGASPPGPIAISNG